MRPHIRLKKRSDANFNNGGFLLADPLSLNETNAGPFTESAGVGGPYSELAGWQEWAQEDWAAGADKEKPDELGFQYGTATTHVAGQVMLPLALSVPDDPYTTTGDISPQATGRDGYAIAASGGYAKWIAIKFTCQVATTHVYFFGTLVKDVTYTCHIYGNAAGSPNTSLVSRTFKSTQSDPTPRWHYGCGVGSLTPAGTYWFILTTASSSPATLYATSNATSDLGHVTSTDGSSWSAPGTPIQFPLLIGQEVSGSASVVGFTDFDSTTYRHSYTALEVWDDTNEEWDAHTTFAAEIRSAVPAFGSLYVALSGANYRVCPAGITGHTDGGSQATLFGLGGGYLWRANGDDLYYTADGTTWQQVETGFGTIEAFSGMEDTAYFTTPTGLYAVFPGDFVVDVMTWPKDYTNGTSRLIHYEGSLWMIAAKTLYRIDSGGSILPIAPFRNTGVAQHAGQMPIAMAVSGTTFYLLTAQVQTNSTYEGDAYLLCWAPEGWHVISHIPLQSAIYSLALNAKIAMRYDRTLELLHIYDSQCGWYLHVANALINPYYDAAIPLAPWGWLETPPFYGNRYLIDKHFDEVSLRAENLETIAGSAPLKTGRAIDVYYRSDDVATWTSLGTIDADGEALRWTGANLAGKWVQLGFRLWSDDYLESPRIKATILKYLSVLTDRARWTVPIIVDGGQRVDDWTYATGVIVDTVARLVALRESQEPLIFEDIDGTQYEVWFVSYNRAVIKYDYHKGSDEVEYAAVYTLILEQFTAGTYN